MSSTDINTHVPLPFPGRLNAWLAFLRPKTCSIAISPVIAALALVFVEYGSIDLSIAFFTISLAVLVILLSNMQNDLGYTQRKAEKGNRKGFPRATSNGWISVKTAKIAIASFALLALIVSIYLSYFAGWEFTIVGICCIIAAYCYMGGPKPLAYGPFSEIVVLLFFGIVAVLGTYYLQTLTVSTSSLLLGISFGAVASAVLCVNNFRDHDHDASVGRKTLAVVIGRSLYSKVFVSYLVLPYILITGMVIINPSLIGALAIFLSAPIVPSILKNFKELRGNDLNKVLFDVVQLEVKLSALFSIGLLISYYL